MANGSWDHLVFKNLQRAHDFSGEGRSSKLIVSDVVVDVDVLEMMNFRQTGEARH